MRPVRNLKLHVRELDHVVLNVSDVERSLGFYCDTLGLKHERLAEFRQGVVKFPSVRLTADTIIDLFPPAMHVNATPGENVNHIALDIDNTAQEIADFLSEHRIEVIDEASNNFGARGTARSFYVRDPDGNMIELRTYR